MCWIRTSPQTSHNFTVSADGEHEADGTPKKVAARFEKWECLDRHFDTGDKSKDRSFGAIRCKRAAFGKKRPYLDRSNLAKNCKKVYASRQ